MQSEKEEGTNQTPAGSAEESGNAKVDDKGDEGINKYPVVTKVQTAFLVIMEVDGSVRPVFEVSSPDLETSRKASMNDVFLCCTALARDAHVFQTAQVVMKRFREEAQKVTALMKGKQAVDSGEGRILQPFGKRK